MIRISWGSLQGQSPQIIGHDCTQVLPQVSDLLTKALRELVLQRTQMTTPASGALPTDIPSLIQSYQAARVLVELPQGGMINPMAVSYNPADMYSLLRAVPTVGYNDSEAVNGSSTCRPSIPASCLMFSGFQLYRTMPLCCSPPESECDCM